MGIEGGQHPIAGCCPNTRDLKLGHPASWRRFTVRPAKKELAAANRRPKSWGNERGRQLRRPYTKGRTIAIATKAFKLVTAMPRYSPSMTLGIIPFARMRSDAVDDLSRAHDAAEPELGRHANAKATFNHRCLSHPPAAMHEPK